MNPGTSIVAQHKGQTATENSGTTMRVDVNDEKADKWIFYFARDKAPRREEPSKSIQKFNQRACAPGSLSFQRLTEQDIDRLLDEDL